MDENPTSTAPKKAAPKKAAPKKAAGLAADTLRERAADWDSLFHFHGPHGAKACIAVFSELAAMIDGKVTVHKVKLPEKKPKI